MSARILKGDAGIEEAVATLAAGGLVALPTETVYGLAALAQDARACAGIFEAKARPLSDPLIVHVPGPEWLERLADPDPLTRQLAGTFWPGPLTLISPKKPCIPELCTAGEPTVALRMSAHPLFLETLSRLKEPVAAPSANRFGRISPTSAQHVFDELGEKIPMILDGGPCVHGIESTIVQACGGVIHILRQGPITRSQLEPFGRVSSQPTGASAPGTLKSHYAPQTPLRLISRDEEAPRHAKGARVGLLAWQNARPGFDAVEVLSAQGDPVMAATVLYGAMRRLDARELDAIWAETPPVSELGDAILDRLRKAAASQ